MSCKAFFSGKSPFKRTLRLGKSFIKVRIYCLLYLNYFLAFFLQIMRFSSNCVIGCNLTCQWESIFTGESDTVLSLQHRRASLQLLLLTQ